MYLGVAGGVCIGVDKEMFEGFFSFSFDERGVKTR
jgi:hypothetical protein